jgi:hypothetical protein
MFITAHKKMDYSLLIGVRKERFEVMTPSAEAPDAARDSVATLSVRNGRITDHVLGRSMSSYGSPGTSTPPRSSAVPRKFTVVHSFWCALFPDPLP